MAKREEDSSYRKILVFTHIPKTGGSSLDRSLRKLAKGRFLRPMVGPGRFDHKTISPLLEGRDEPDIITGHFRFDQAEAILQPLLTRPLTYVGTIRDPLDRVRSRYSFLILKYGSSDNLNERLGVRVEDGIDAYMERWLDITDGFDAKTNMMCRFLCGEPSARKAMENIESRYLAVVTVKSVSQLIRLFYAAANAGPGPDLHLKLSNSERFSIRPDLERSFRVANREDQDLFEWVRDNEARLLAKAADIVPSLWNREKQAAV
jgi:hypothetical protein